jgi:hypothetical protein
MTKSEKVAIALIKKAIELKRAGLYCLVAVATINLGACGGFAVSAPPADGEVILRGEKAIRAFYDGQNGMITNGKASPDKDTAHWQLRKKQTREDTVQKYAPSFLGGIFGTQTTSLPVDKEPAQPVAVVGSDQGAIVQQTN